MATPDFISHARLSELLSYDPATGIFVWIGNRGPRWLAGKEAGSLTTSGYRAVTVDGYSYLMHRLAWFYMHRRWPELYIDHINGDRTDNRISNLRDVSQSTNILNVALQSTKNNTGIRGVSLYRGKFKVEIEVRKIRRYVGLFDDLEEAARAYMAAKREMSGVQEFPR